MAKKNLVGVDVCQWDRMKIEDEAFLKRFLHETEYAYLKSLKNSQDKKAFAAGRWAAKEALYKIYQFKFSFAKVRIDSYGNVPRVVKPEQWSNTSLSIAHDGGLAIAIAISDDSE